MLSMEERPAVVKGSRPAGLPNEARQCHSERPSSQPDPCAHCPGSASHNTHPNQNPDVAGRWTPSPFPSPLPPTAGAAARHAGRTVDAAGENNWADSYDLCSCIAHRRADHADKVPIP